MRKNLLVLAFVVALICSARADLVTNGSFESGSYPGGGFATLGTGSTAITGWTVSSGSVDWIFNYWQPGDGSYSIDLSGNQQGGLKISTDLNTEAGHTYLLSFLMSGNPDGGPVSKHMIVTVGSTAYDFYFDVSNISRSNMGWVEKTLVFTATGITSLNFASDTGTAYGPALDRVSVSEVPEPGSLMLFGSGITGLAGLIRRKLRK